MRKLTLALIGLLVTTASQAASGKVVLGDGDSVRVAYSDTVVGSGILKGVRRVYGESQVWEFDASQHGPAFPWWNRELSPRQFFKSKLWKPLATFAAQVSNQTGSPLYPLDVSAHVLRRGDEPRVHSSAPQSETGEDSASHSGNVNLIVYLERDWRKNAYGEMVFFDEARHNVIASVHPQKARIVAWDADIPFLVRPPAVSRRSMMMFLLVQLTPNAAAAQAAADSYRRREAHDESMLAKLVERDEEESAPIDLGRLVTRMVNDTYGQPVVIVDGLFSERELTAMRQHVEEQQLWSFDDVTHHDDGTYDNGDNVKWLGGANVAAYLETSVWRKTKRLMDAMTPDSLRQWHPYDVTTNLIRTSDDTRIHYDCSHDDQEWTFLVYLTPHWCPDFWGQTAFYTPPAACVRAPTHPRCRETENFELLTEVQPKYGRVALFHGTTLHAARPPSPLFRGPRFTFVSKMLATKALAEEKIRQESMDD